MRLCLCGDCRAREDFIGGRLADRRLPGPLPCSTHITRRRIVRKRDFFALALIGSLAFPALAGANARLTGVVALDGGCVSGPTGPTVQFWDVQPGKTYQVTISNVA